MGSSKKIALTGIATAMATVLIIVGNYTQLLNYSFYLLASMCCVIPFVFGEIKWGVLAVIVSTVLGSIFAPDLISMLAYLVFFAPHALIANILRMKNIVHWLCYIVKGLFFAVSITLIYSLSTLFIEINQWNLSMPLMLVLAFVGMYVFDYMMNRVYIQVERQVRRHLKF